jgi:hypothetical protein
LELDLSGRVVGQGAGQPKVDVRIELGGGLSQGGRPVAAEGGIAQNGKEQATRDEHAHYVLRAGRLDVFPQKLKRRALESVLVLVEELLDEPPATEGIAVVVPDQ